MAKQTTYAFKDTVGSIHSPAVQPDYIFTGEGVGSITVTKSTERTAHDVAADGSVMVSKIEGENGSVTIECQQSSPVHRWLEKWFEAINNSKTENWANSTMLIKNSSVRMGHICTGVSPAKEADNPYQAQGQRVTWQLMCAEIQNITL